MTEESKKEWELKKLHMEIQMSKSVKGYKLPEGGTIDDIPVTPEDVTEYITTLNKRKEAKKKSRGMGYGEDLIDAMNERWSEDPSYRPE